MANQLDGSKRSNQIYELDSIRYLREETAADLHWQTTYGIDSCFLRFHDMPLWHIHLLFYNEKWMLNLTANSGLFMFHFFVLVKTFEIISHFETGRTFIYSEINLGFLLIVLNCRLVNGSKITRITIYYLIIFSDEVCGF